MKKIKVLHRRKRNTKSVVKEVAKMFKILDDYDRDTRAYMFEEIKEFLTDRECKVKDYIINSIQALKNEGLEDEEIREFNNKYIERFKTLDLNLLEQWQNNIIKIKNIEYDMIVERVVIRKVY